MATKDDEGKLKDDKNEADNKRRAPEVREDKDDEEKVALDNKGKVNNEENELKVTQDESPRTWIRPTRTAREEQLQSGHSNPQDE